MGRARSVPPIAAATGQRAPILATDNFNRSDGAIGSPWSTGLQIVSNTARSTSGTAVSYRDTGLTLPADFYVQVAVGNLASGRNVGLGLGNAAYTGATGVGDGLLVSTFLGAVLVMLDESGNSVSFTTGGNPAVANNDVLRLEARGQNLAVYLNGVAKATYTSFSEAFRYKVVLTCQHDGTSSSTADNFQMGTL